MADTVVKAMIIQVEVEQHSSMITATTATADDLHLRASQRHYYRFSELKKSVLSLIKSHA